MQPIKFGLKGAARYTVVPEWMLIHSSNIHGLKIKSQQILLLKDWQHFLLPSRKVNGVAISLSSHIIMLDHVCGSMKETLFLRIKLKKRKLISQVRLDQYAFVLLVGMEP